MIQINPELKKECELMWRNMSPGMKANLLGPHEKPKGILYVANEFFYNHADEFRTAMQQWKYDRLAFKIGGEDTLFTPSLMPIISHMAWSYDKFLSHEMFFHLVLTSGFSCSGKNYSQEDYANGRCHQAYVAGLREFFAEVNLLTIVKDRGLDIEIYKPIYYDLKTGADIVLKYGSFIRTIAIKHRGKRSSEFFEKRKSQKEKADYSVWADQTLGWSDVHVVPRKDLNMVVEDFLKGIK